MAGTITKLVLRFSNRLLDLLFVGNEVSIYDRVYARSGGAESKMETWRNFRKKRLMWGTPAVCS